MNGAEMDLSGISERLVTLVQKAEHGVLAVDAAPYRVTSGVSLGGGLIAVTNHSLRREPTVVWTVEKKEAPARVLGRDPTLDIAVLRAEGSTIEPLPLAPAESLRPGMLALVVGMTKDVGASVSLGILGAVGGSRRTWRGGTLDQFLRLDVNLYPSQLGAAVVDAEGRLIGMATGALSRHSVIAVPFTTANRIAQELVKEGRIRRGYLGIGVQPVAVPAKLAAKLNLNSETGLMVMSVENDSAAEKAGLQIGDILTALSGNPTADIDDLQAELGGESVGRIATAKVIRGGDIREFEIVISDRVKKGK